MPNFEDCRKFEKKYQPLLDAQLYAPRKLKFVRLREGSLATLLQKEWDIDCLISTADRGLAAVEEKIVQWKEKELTAIVLETHSNLERTGSEPFGDGWALKCEAQYLLWAFEQPDKQSVLVWIFNFVKLKAWFLEGRRYARFKTHDEPNWGNNGALLYTTRSCIVPLDQIPPKVIIRKGRLYSFPKSAYSDPFADAEDES